MSNTQLDAIARKNSVNFGRMVTLSNKSGSVNADDNVKAFCNWTAGIFPVRSDISTDKPSLVCAMSVETVLQAMGMIFDISLADSNRLFRLHPQTLSKLADINNSLMETIEAKPHETFANTEMLTSYLTDNDPHTAPDDLVRDRIRQLISKFFNGNTFTELPHWEALVALRDIYYGAKRLGMTLSAINLLMLVHDTCLNLEKELHERVGASTTNVEAFLGNVKELFNRSYRVARRAMSDASKLLSPISVKDGVHVIKCVTRVLEEQKFMEDDVLLMLSHQKAMEESRSTLELQSGFKRSAGAIAESMKAYMRKIESQGSVAAVTEETTKVANSLLSALSAMPAEASEYVSEEFIELLLRDVVAMQHRDMRAEQLAIEKTTEAKAVSETLDAIRFLDLDYVFDGRKFANNDERVGILTLEQLRTVIKARIEFNTTETISPDTRKKVEEVCAYMKEERKNGPTVTCGMFFLQLGTTPEQLSAKKVEAMSLRDRLPWMHPLHDVVEAVNADLEVLSKTDHNPSGSVILLVWHNLCVELSEIVTKYEAEQAKREDSMSAALEQLQCLTRYLANEVTAAGDSELPMAVRLFNMEVTMMHERAKELAIRYDVILNGRS